MTDAAALLAAIRHLPAGSKLTVTVEKDDLVRALEERDDNPGRIVTTVWCSEHLGMSREWWADECRSGRIRDASQEGPGAPWYLPVGVARAHLQAHRSKHTPARRRRRGPRPERRTQ